MVIKQTISSWGGVDAVKGIITERRHEIRGGNVYVEGLDVLRLAEKQFGVMSFELREMAGLERMAGEKNNFEFCGDKP